MGDMVPKVVPLDRVERYAGQDCTNILRDLQKVVRKVTDREIKKQQDEAKKVEKDFERRKAGGFWDRVTSGPLGEFEKEISDVQTDYNEAARQKQGFLEKYQGYFDVAQNTLTLGSNLATGITSSVIDELSVIDALGEAAGMGSVMPTGGSESCEDDLLTGTISSVFNIGKVAVDTAVQSVFAVQSSIGLALEVLPELYAGLMSQPAGLLSIILTNKQALLDRIDSTIQQAMSIVSEMDDDDYPFDHRAFILAAKANLEEADADMVTVEDILRSGGLFQEVNWTRARRTIKSTGKDLLAIGAGSLIPGFTHMKILQILGYQKALNMLIQVLDQRQSIFAQLTSNISKFQANFQASAKFQNLMAPIVQQVRCALQQIISDMEQTVNVNALLRYYLKEKWWGVELVGLATYMVHTEHMGKDLSLGTAAMNTNANAFADSIGEAEEYFVGAESYEILTGLLANFSRELKTKASRNTDPSILQRIADAIYVEIERQRQSNSGLAEILNGFNSSIAVGGVTAVQAVAGLMDLMDAQGLDTMVDSIRNGDIASFFSIESLTRQLESTARKAIGEVVQCCTDNAGDGDVTTKLTNMNRVMIDLQKGKDLFDKFTSGYSEAYINAVYKTNIPKLHKMNKDAAAAGRSPCINQGETGDIGPLGLTLI